MPSWPTPFRFDVNGDATLEVRGPVVYAYPGGHHCLPARLFSTMCRENSSDRGASPSAWAVLARCWALTATPALFGLMLRRASPCRLRLDSRMKAWQQRGVGFVYENFRIGIARSRSDHRRRPHCCLSWAQLHAGSAKAIRSAGLQVHARRLAGGEWKMAWATHQQLRAALPMWPRLSSQMARAPWRRYLGPASRIPPPCRAETDATRQDRRGGTAGVLAAIPAYRAKCHILGDRKSVKA